MAWIEGNMIDVGGFRDLVQTETSTRFCPCGQRFTWTGYDAGLDPWVKEHTPHAEAALKKKEEALKEVSSVKMTEPLAEPHLLAVLEDGSLATKREAEVMAAEILSLRSQNEELQRNFNLRWDADMKAISRWQMASTDRELVFPDHVDLCFWLLERLSTERKKVDRGVEIENAARDVLRVYGCDTPGCDCTICILRRELAREVEATSTKPKSFRWTRGRRRMMHLFVRREEDAQAVGHTLAEDNLLELINAGFIQLRVTEAGIDSLADEAQGSKED